jgi:RNA polymerase sigma-70 factor, ECF subfamily
MTSAETAAFQSVRPRLFGIAYRIVGNRADADDIVQDAWVRWQTTDRSNVRDAAAFLATTTTRLAINFNQSARARRVTSSDAGRPEAADPHADPVRLTERRHDLDVATRLLLEKLTPGERAAFVLREAFDYSYRDIATVLGAGEANARQLAKRARKNLDSERRNPVGVVRRRRFGTALLAAAQLGEIAQLEQLLTAELTSSVSRPAVLSGLPC